MIYFRTLGSSHPVFFFSKVPPRLKHYYGHLILSTWVFLHSVAVVYHNAESIICRRWGRTRVGRWCFMFYKVKTVSQDWLISPPDDYTYAAKWASPDPIEEPTERDISHVELLPRPYTRAKCVYSHSQYEGPIRRCNLWGGAYSTLARRTLFWATRKIKVYFILSRQEIWSRHRQIQNSLKLPGRMGPSYCGRLYIQLQEL